MFHLGDTMEDLSPEDSSQIALSDCLGRLREDPGYTEVLQKKKKKKTIKRTINSNKQTKNTIYLKLMNVTLF